MDNPQPNTIRLRRLLEIDQTVTNLPLPLGGGRWAWMRQVAQRTRLHDEARALLRASDVVLALDTDHQQVGIAYGEVRLQRIADTDQAEDCLVLRVILDGTARQAFPATNADAIQDDLDFLAALVSVAKDEPIEDDDGEGKA